MAVTVEMGSTFQAASPRALFQAEGLIRFAITDTLDYEATADGQRFLVNTRSSTVVPITAVLNWTSVLNSR